MKVIAINGSPRKGWNTHMLLEKALEGAKANGAEVQMLNLFDLNFKGCIGCLACKLKGGNVTQCALKDDLTPILQSMEQIDAIVMGSPIYLNEVTGALRSFIERLVFPYISYDEYGKRLFEGEKKMAFVFTTNCPESRYEDVGYIRLFKGYEDLFARMFGHCKTLAVGETMQTNDYSKYHMAIFNPEDRRRRRDEVFPQECEKAFELGQWLAQA